MSRTRPTCEVMRTDDEVLAMVRCRLRLALKMLGERPADTVLDESLAGAGILARDVEGLLDALLERRLGRDDA